MGVFSMAEARAAALEFMQKLAVNLRDKGKVSGTGCAGKATCVALHLSIDVTAALDFMQKLAVNLRNKGKVS
jgi:hypothetical protein